MKPSALGRHTRERRKRPHDVSFSGVDIHFTMTMQLKERVDLSRATRRLLNAGIAVSAAWPAEDWIRVPDSHRKFARDLRRARNLYSDYVRADAARTWKEGLRFAVRHPKLGMQHLRALRAPSVLADLDELMKDQSLRAVAIFVLKHPLAGVLHVLPMVRFGETGRDSHVSGVSAEEALSIAPEAADLQDDDSDDEDPLKTLNEAEEFILEQQLLSAAERLSDRSLFGGREHDENRFVRIHLKDSVHRFGIPDSADSEEVIFEPRLLLHESGIAQLSLQLRAKGPLSRGQVQRLMSGPSPRILYSEMPSSLARGPLWRSANETSQGAAQSGEPVKVRHVEPVSLTDAGLAHLDAVLAATGLQGGDWVHYPIAVVEAGGCCSNAEWESQHVVELQQLALRMPFGMELSDDMQPPSNLSLSADHLLYAELGSAIYVHMHGDLPRGIEQLRAILVLEYALLTYQRLAAMEQRVSELTLNERSLRRRYREAIELFSALRQGDVRAGEARQIIRHLLAAMGADQMRGTIETALNLTGNAHATVSASRAARRSWWITLLATLIAALVAAPSIQEVIESARTVSEDGLGSSMIAVLHSAGSLGFWGPWVLMAGMLAGTAGLMFVGWILRHRIRSWPSFRKGYPWPNPIESAPGDADFTSDQLNHVNPTAGLPR